MADMPRLRVGVVFGGRSGEHEGSLASAASVIAALEERGHTVVPIGIARNGRWVVGGEPLRALAAEARVALPSNDADGAVKKALANRAEAVESAAIEGLARTEPAGSLPLELSQVATRGALAAAMDLAARHDRKIISERAVNAREIEVSVLGNEEPIASLPGEISFDAEWYDYSTKYLEGQSRLTIPAPVPPETTKRLQ